MKPHLLRLFIFLLLSSCNIINNDFLEPRQYGIKFEIINRTDQEFEHTQVIIGGIDENNEFIVVDSYALPKIKTGLQQVLSGYDDIRWKPDFETIRNIGEGKAYFKFQFMDKDANFIEWNGDQFDYIFLDLIKQEHVYDNYGNLKLYIENNQSSTGLEIINGYIYGMTL